MFPTSEGPTVAQTSRSWGLPSWPLLRALSLWVLMLSVLALAPSLAHAGNPDQRWRTLETEHFYIHFASGNEEAAERVARTGERAYRNLTEAWGHSVFLKTHVTIVDSTDQANGFANATPYPRITAFTTAPDTQSVLESYDDWLDILFTHELVHVVHLDTVHGLNRLINGALGFGVLGKVVSPNVVQPRWVVEGMATMQESKFSTQGRRRSALFDAYIRAAVLEGTFQTIDQVSNGARIFPHGSSVYLYGVHLIHYIAARYGQDKLRELSHIYAGQLVPYGINKAIEKVLGVTFYQLWEEFKVDTKRRFKAQARRMRARGLRQGRRLTFSGQTTRFPVWSNDDGYIYFYKADGHREEGLKRIKASGGRVREGTGIGRQGSDVDIEHVVDLENAGEASFVGATADLVYDQLGTHDYRYSWSDLWRYNGGDPMRAEQLTFGLRASEPHVSPDGRTVAFRRNDTAQARLAFLDLSTGDVQEVAPMDRVSQVNTPRFHPDGIRVAFSGWRDGGYRDIYIFNRETGKLQRVTADRYNDLSPNWSPDGRYLIFTSDRDDVYNIYAFDTDSELLHQVSNVLGGAFEPAISHDGTRIAYAGFGARGHDLWVMDFDPTRWVDPLPATSDLPPVDDPKPELEGHNGRAATLSSQRYRPGRTFFPRVIFPTAFDFQSAGFGTSLGFDTAVSDHLAFHSLVLLFNYNATEKLASGRFSYTFDRLWPSFTLTGSRGFVRRSSAFTRYDYERRGGGAEDYLQRGYRERDARVSLSTSLPVLRHARHRASFGLRYEWIRWTNLDADKLAIDPNAPAVGLPEVGDSAEVTLRMAYSNESDGGGQFSYGVEQGRSASVRLGVVDRRLGGDFSDISVAVRYNETLRMPWRGHQSLALRVAGGASAGGFRGRGGQCLGDFTFGGDAIRALLGRTPYGTAGCTLLRGYDVRARGGLYMAKATAEYRIPLVDVDRGIGTLPFFFSRVGLIPFVDVGNAWVEPSDIRDVLVGTGAALVFSFRLGYAEAISLLLKYAHGFDDEIGANSFRAVISTGF